MLSRNRKPWGSAKKARQAKALSNPLKASMVAGHMAKEATSRAQDKAEAFGCEYTSVFLKAWFDLNGCAACGKHDPRGFHPHHTDHRSKAGKAASITPLCPSCHTEDRFGVEKNAASDHRVDLFKVAEWLAAAGREQGWLPVERCEAEECGTWHSSRLMLDVIDQTSGAMQRICLFCAPEGPK